MSLWIRIGALGVAALLAMGPAPGHADELTDAVAAVPANVDDLKVIGSWRVGDFRGTYRLVVARFGPTPVRARLFVQWIALENNGEARVESSVEVDELAALEANITALRTKVERDGLLVFIDTAGGEPGAPTTYELALGPPDQYRFGPFTN